MLTTSGGGILHRRGCLRWVPGKPNIHVTRPSLCKTLGAVPLGSNPPPFWSQQVCLVNGSAPGPFFKKALCRSRPFGGERNKYLDILTKLVFDSFDAPWRECWRSPAFTSRGQPFSSLRGAGVSQAVSFLGGATLSPGYWGASFQENADGIFGASRRVWATTLRPGTP